MLTHIRNVLTKWLLIGTISYAALAIFYHSVWIPAHDALVPPAHAETYQGLSFGTALLKGAWLGWTITTHPTDYKAVRMREIREIIRTEFPSLESHASILIAHLYSENGAMTEDSITDHGCSYGLLQWNTCAHYNMKATAYLAKHPDMKEYRNQVRFYLADMQGRIQGHGIDYAIGSWNPGAFHREISRAYAALPLVAANLN